MTSVTMAACERNMDTAVRPRGSLEELVNWLMTVLFSEEPKSAPPATTPSLARSIHEAWRLRQEGKIDSALAMLAGMNMSRAETRQTRWAFTEWKQLVRRWFGDGGALT